jgi:hypothetical protein
MRRAKNRTTDSRRCQPQALPANNHARCMVDLIAVSFSDLVCTFFCSESQLRSTLLWLIHSCLVVDLEVFSSFLRVKSLSSILIVSLHLSNEELKEILPLIYFEFLITHPPSPGFGIWFSSYQPKPT